MEAPVVELSRSLIQNPVHVTIKAEQPAVERIIQKVMFVDQKNKNKLILDVFSNKELDRVIVFTQMKHVANRVCQTLEKQGIRAAAIHGNKGQTARTRALADFKSGKVQALVATDIAARGIDVDSISHVINYDMPIEPETYVHRIGRTARAGADGDAISFCSAAERSYLNEIQKLIRIDIPVDLEHAFHCEQSMNAKGASAKAPSKQQRPSSHRRKTSAASEGRSGQSSGKKRPPHRRKRQSRSRNGGSSGSV
jgi:ATP-dependent RNA helicase RhlE